jgi:hypothetical protein
MSSSLKERILKLEAMIPQDPDYGEVYDFLFQARQTIDCPPGENPDFLAEAWLGDRQTFINDRRVD